jgi:hypothetical protein
MIKHKKGIQLNEAIGAVLTITLVALLVIVAIVVFTNMNTATAAPSTVGSVINESLAKATATGITLTTGSVARSGACGPLTRIMNTTGNYPIGLGNVTQTGCLVQNKSTSTEWVALGSTWQYSYTYTYTAETAASNASNSMMTNFSGYPALIGLVGTIIFLALVIGVLVASFAFGGKPGV